MAKVLTNGKFCLLHVGHFNLLNYCRRIAGLDGYIVAAIDSDERIMELEGKPPIFTAAQRKTQLLKLQILDRPMVNHVWIFNSEQHLLNIIAEFRPDWMVKGSEWEGKKVIGADRIPIKYYTADAWDEQGYKISSSDIVKTVLERYGKQGI